MQSLSTEVWSGNLYPVLNWYFTALINVQDSIFLQAVQVLCGICHFQHVVTRWQCGLFIFNKKSLGGSTGIVTRLLGDGCNLLYHCTVKS